MLTGLAGLPGLDAGEDTVAAVYGQKSPVVPAIMLTIVLAVTADLPADISFLIRGHSFTSQAILNLIRFNFNTPDWIYDMVSLR